MSKSNELTDIYNAHKVEEAYIQGCRDATEDALFELSRLSDQLRSGMPEPLKEEE